MERWCAKSLNMSQGCCLISKAAAGVGKRGASAIDRLVANGRVANAEVWCVDSDRRALDACAASHTLLLSDQQSSVDVSPGHEWTAFYMPLCSSADCPSS